MFGMSAEELPPPPWKPRRRRRAARPALSVEAIVAAALRVLRAEGLDAVTMRRVADELGTGAASLYVHVADKDELHALMLDQVVGQLSLPAPEPDRWQEQLKDVCRDMLRLMEVNVGIARVAIANVPLGPNALAWLDWTLGLLRAAGVPDQVAAYACDILPLYVTAVGFEHSIYAAAGFDEAAVADRVTQMRTYFTSLPAERFPNVVALAVPLTTGAGDDRFEFGLDVLVQGLAATVR
jgi:AcrR family transcriptional regulator